MPGTAMMKVTMTTNMTMTTIAKMTTSTGEMVVVGLVMVVVVVRLMVVMIEVTNSTPKHARLNGRFMTASPTDAHATRHFNGEYT